MGNFSVTWKTAGPRTLTVTEDGDTLTASSSPTVKPAAASRLAVTGFPTTTVANSLEGFTVTAYDPFDNIATGYTGTITFTSSDGAAELPGNYHFTVGDAGHQNFGARLHTAGTQSITATDTVTGSITGTQSGISGVAAGSGTHLSVSGYTNPTTAGASHPITVAALDNDGNVDTGYTGTVTFTSTDGNATLPGDYTFTGADAGSNSFSGVRLFTAGSRSITATDTGTGSNNGTQSGITNNVGAVTHFLMSGFPGTTSAGDPHNVTVTAKDVGDNTVTGYTGTVTITSSDGLATLPSPHDYVSGDLGTHVFSVTLNSPGTQSITAGDGVSTASQTGISVNTGPGSPGQTTIIALDPTITTDDSSEHHCPASGTLAEQPCLVERWHGHAQFERVRRPLGRHGQRRRHVYRLLQLDHARLVHHQRRTQCGCHHRHRRRRRHRRPARPLRGLRIHRSDHGRCRPQRHGPSR